jgi:hypothetical protein
MKLLAYLTAVPLILTLALLIWLSSALRTSTVSSTLDLASMMNAAATLLGVSATLLVAYLIGYLHTSRTSSKTADNDVLLQVLGDVKTAFLSLHHYSTPCQCGKKLTAEQKTQLLAAEREVSQSVHSLDAAIKHCGLAADSKLSLAGLKEARSELKDSLTDSPYPGPYPDPARQRIARASRSFRDEMNKLSFAIIRR